MDPSASSSFDQEMDLHSVDRKISLNPSEFIYSDLDTLENELGEIYGYYEFASLSYNYDVFRVYTEKKIIGKWLETKLSIKCNFIHDILDDLELVDEYRRFNAILAICYLIQGCWNDLQTATEQLRCIEENVILLLRCDGFWRTWNLFNRVTRLFITKAVPCEWGLEERTIDNCLSILCTITNVALMKRNVPVIDDFIAEIKSDDGDLAIVSVLDIFVNVVKRSSRSFLLKKILLLTRNLIMLSAGDSNDLRKLKDECRKKAGLNPSKEDTILHCRQISLLQTNSGWNNLKSKSNLITLAELDEHVNHTKEAENLASATNEKSNKSLPWSSKSSLEQLGDCVKESTMYTLQHKQNLPKPIQQKIFRLVQHLHVPLATFQLQAEGLIQEYPNTLGNMELPFVERTEKLFTALFQFPMLQHWFTDIITILSDACSVSNHAKFSKLNVAPHFVPRYGGDESYFLEDSMRQAEIIVKAVSTILILLLKHTKLNHIYQFECIASEIVAVDFIPTALRFFNSNVNRQVCRRSFLSCRHPDCPFAAIHIDLNKLQPSLNNRMSHSSNEFCEISWRNMLSYVNLLRILNKVVKRKPSRILMLNMFNAQSCLIRCLNVKDSLIQQYILKLLKHQCKYLDQEWKRENQRTISAIYHKVRHRLLKDWIGEISSNKVRRQPDHKPKVTKWPWEFCNDEVQLFQNIQSYLRRKFTTPAPTFSSDQASKAASGVENNYVSIKNDLPDSFKQTYENWIQQEVFSKSIKWDSLLYPQYLV